MAVDPKPPLPVYDVLMAAMVISAADREAKVAWLDENQERVDGTIRHLHLKPHDDMREVRIRVTLDTGMDMILSLFDLVEKDSFLVLPPD